MKQQRHAWQAERNCDTDFTVPSRLRLRFVDGAFGPDADALLDVLQPSAESHARVQIWIDEHVAAARADLVPRIEAFLNRYADRVKLAGPIQFAPGGEAVKNDVQVLQQMLKVFNHEDLDRRSYVLVIGGGAVLDAVGFAAAIAHRGIRLVRLPTTSLAQADSGVGVKNGVNLFGKKNWVGSFAVPWAVVNDAGFLSTLGQRDFICGFAEAVKVSLLKEPGFFDSICDQATAIRQREMDRALPVIQRSAIWHLRHITQGGDPFEALEARPLDFGHWSAHKLEPMSDFQLRHGEAVAIGLAIDTVYSQYVHGLPAAQANRVLNCLRDLGFSLYTPLLEDTKELFLGLEEFRQHLGGRLTVTMLEEVGRPIDVHTIHDAAMLAAIAAVAEFGKGSAREETQPAQRRGLRGA